MEPTVPVVEDTKKWWQSKGAVGALVAVAALVLGQLGYVIVPSVQAEVVEAWGAVVAIGASIMSLIGRITATKRIAS